MLLLPEVRLGTSETVILDAPEHEDDGSDDGEDQGVGEVSVERQLDDVPAKAKGPGRLDQRGEDPPTDGTVTKRTKIDRILNLSKSQLIKFPTHRILNSSKVEFIEFKLI